ncbi:hypothetical protein Taro_044519 [Colocasia esculenta]|uniref:RNase H type-1 domain-containing protein n=1 Tax=Colocasia esculenta TaxID=4460 RepID=A0A843X0Z7_COLES|nr:hypothetical protein [Colocasia esculenta]
MKYLGVPIKSGRLKVNDFKPPKIVRWNPPFSNYNINVDGACKGNLGICGGGGCFRNTRGDFVCGFAFLYGSGSSLLAETRALHDGLRLALERNLNVSIVYSDSATLVRAISMGRLPHWVVFPWWRGIRSMVQILKPQLVTIMLKSSLPAGRLGEYKSAHHNSNSRNLWVKLTCDWFSRVEFEKFVDDLILRKIEVQELVVDVSKKKYRGPQKLTSMHGLDNGKRIVVHINEFGQPVGEGGHSLKLFLGTIVHLNDTMPIDAPTWRAMSAIHKDDVWEYVQRKYDIPTYLKEWVMNDLDQKWGSWKYELRNKNFNPTLKQNEQDIPPDLRVNVEQWKRVFFVDSQNRFTSTLSQHLGPVVSILGIAHQLEHLPPFQVASRFKKEAITYSPPPHAPLFVKDNERKTIQDAIGSHIVWFRDFVELDDT